MKRELIMAWKVSVSSMFFLFAFIVPDSKAWSGNYCTRLAFKWTNQKYCIARYWWGCSAWRDNWVPVYYTEQYCCSGWTHNGNQACTIPICYPACKNGERCINPNVCTSSMLVKSAAPQCSYQYPCYPGECAAPNNCTCFKGFGGLPTLTVGCRDIISDHEKPQLSKVLAILADLKRIPNAPDELIYEYVTDATNKNDTEMIWSNQATFNLLSFEFESIYVIPNGFPAQRPTYIHDYGIGIVEASIHVNLTKIPRNGGPIRDVYLDQTYNCSEFSYLRPILNIAGRCYIKDRFSIPLSHGDLLTVTFQAGNGGFRTRLNTDNGMLLSPDIVMGKTEKKRIEFRFDFETAFHCADKDKDCPEKPLAITEDITKKPIGIYWGGWNDGLSGMWQYYLEIFYLSPDLYGRLIEPDALDPIFTQVINETAPHHVTYTPKEPGMYSVLLEVRDMANNSKTARRLCLYDNVSTVEIDTTKEHKLYVSTASSISGYMWQASPDVVTVVWNGHFFNRIHREKKLLNQVLAYPIQFKEVEEDGILSSSKYVFEGLDDEEGRRSIHEITNINGIVRFEVHEDFTNGVNEPTSGWKDISPLAESYTFQAKLFSGKKIKVWVRASDVLGNSAHDYAEVKFDGSPPVVGQTTFLRNHPNGRYKYCSRFTFDAMDEDSGVHTFHFKLVMNETGEVKYTGTSLANFNPDPTACKTDNECRCVDNICFKVNQILDIDNCWFLTKTSLLKSAKIILHIMVTNQAGISQSFSQEVDDLQSLSGLSDTSGPRNIKTSNVQANGVRLNWELPDSCFGETDVVIEIVETGSKYRVTKESKFVDVIALEERKKYTARFRMIYRSEDLGISVPFTFETGSAATGLGPVDSSGSLSSLVESALASTSGGTFTQRFSIIYFLCLLTYICSPFDRLI